MRKKQTLTLVELGEMSTGVRAYKVQRKKNMAEPAIGAILSFKEMEVYLRQVGIDVLFIGKE